MASIVFRPTCSGCKKILESETINVEEETVELYSPFKTVECSMQYNISPYKCPYCGEMFDNIIAPGNMSFPVSDENLISYAEKEE